MLKSPALFSHLIYLHVCLADVAPVMSGLSLLPGLRLVQLKISTGFLPKKVRFTVFRVTVVWQRQIKTINSFLIFTQTATNPDMTIGASEWLIANIDMKGFYRVNYDSENWDRILTKLSTQHQV